MKKICILAGLTIFAFALFINGLNLLSVDKKATASAEVQSFEDLPTFTAHLPGHFVWAGSAASRTVSRLADDVRDRVGYNLIVNIPAYINNDEPVTTIGANAFSGLSANSNGNIIEVIIPDSITTIPVNAFRDNIIRSVTIGTGVTNLPNDVFRNNDLSSITIPGNVQAIGNNTFRNNELANITLHEGILSLGSDTFRDNRAQIVNVNIPNSITTIGANTFRQSQLQAIALGSGLISIGNDAFTDNQLTELAIPDNVTTIGLSSFRNNLIEDLTIGSGLTAIPNNAFRNNQLVDLVIPGSVLHVGDHAFRENGVLETVTLLVGVQTIGAEAFGGGSGALAMQIREVIIPYTVTDIGFRAFNDNMIESLTFEVDEYEKSNLEYIRGDAFRNNPPLATVWLPDGLHTIETGAFRTLFNLEKVFIPSSVTTVGALAFSRTWSNIPTNTYATIFVEHTYANRPVGWASNAIPIGQTTGTMPIHSPNSFNFIVWGVEREPTITITHISGNITTHTVGLWESFSPTLQRGRVQNVIINGQSLTNEEGVLSNRSATWERGEFNTRNFVLDLLLVGHDLDIVIQGDRIWDVNFTNHHETVSINTDAYNEGSVTLPAVTVDRRGHTFGGWNVGGDIMQSGEIVGDITENMTIAAVWNLIDYTITFRNVLDNVPHDNRTTFTIETPTFALTEPTETPAGWKFVGWFDSLFGGNQVIQIITDTIGNQIVYGRWEVVNFQVNFDAIGGSYVFSQTVQCSLGRAQSPSATRDGYVLVGWSIHPEGYSGERTLFNFGDTSITGNITLYAVWKVYTPDATDDFPWIIIAGIVGALFLIGLLILILRRKKDKKI